MSILNNVTMFETFTRLKNIGCTMNKLLHHDRPYVLYDNIIGQAKDVLNKGVVRGPGALTHELGANGCPVVMLHS